MRRARSRETNIDDALAPSPVVPTYPRTSPTKSPGKAVRVSPSASLARVVCSVAAAN